MHLENNTLYYIYDPMCSWCYAFEASLTEIKATLPSLLTFKSVLGGLAPDSNHTMPVETQTMVQRAWHKIEQSVPSIQFNFDFWSKNTPIRSTYPACRAILAAELQGSDFTDAMRKSIQKTYYQDAQNPSLNSVLLRCAESTQLNKQQFTDDFFHADTQQALTDHIQFSHTLSARSYPSLRLVINQEIHTIPINYTQAQVSIQKIQQLLNQYKTRAIASPCIRQCCLNEQDMCLGCYRLLNEITAWSLMSEVDQQQCLDQCAQRKSSFIIT